MARLELFNWDDEFEVDMLRGKGFVVTEKPFKTVKGKEEKTMNGLHSPRFATDWKDEDAFAERYSCVCGELRGKVFEGDKCPQCNSIVTFRDVDLSLFAWIDLQGYKIINPAYFRILKRLASESVWYDIMSIEDINKMGNESKGNPFKHIGLLELQSRFEEIVLYFAKKKKRMDLAETLIKEKRSVFCSHIPVYSSVLRPVMFVGEEYRYTTEDKKYNSIYRSSKLLTPDSFELILTKKKKKNKKKNVDLTTILFDIQRRVNDVWDVVFEKLDQKKGHIKGQILGGRVNFSARNVIIPDGRLHADQIGLCYLSFLELFKYELIPLIAKIYGMTEIEAYEEWYKATINYDSRIYEIMVYYLKKKKPEVLINRNPTIKYGSILLMKIKFIKNEFNKDYTMSIPISILTALNADL